MNAKEAVRREAGIARAAKAGERPQASSPQDFSAADFRRRVADRLADRGEAVGDHSFNPGWDAVFREMKRRPAAVLVPVVDRGAEATILLTRRTATLRSHAGQIAFPGGGIDATDEGPEAAALREAQEEIGLSPEFVEPLGLAADYLTGSGYRIAPVLAVVRPGFTLTLNPDEVADVFEVPLSFLMNPANHRRNSREWQGMTRFFFEMPYRDWHIWGITAGILRILYERLYLDPEAESSS